jgi:hypothetical protein
LEKTEVESAENKRKYFQMMSKCNDINFSDFSDIHLEKLVELANSKIDSEEVSSKIAGYHATLNKKGYDHVWRERLDLIIRILKTGERYLPRVLSIVRRTEECKRKMNLEDRNWVVNDRPVALPWMPAASAYRSSVFEAVIACVRPTTSKIIETGSGWGEHLCNVFLEGGPFDATYYALEMEEEGRKCALLLAALEPAFRLESHHFDYLNPDYSCVPKDDGHTILLTAHSIEQVSCIHEDCILKALELGREVSGIHFEPVGWQTYDKNKWTEISKKHQQRCKELNYNKNLLALLSKIQEDGLIKIKEIKTNFIGLDQNPATYIHWEKTG